MTIRRIKLSDPNYTPDVFLDTVIFHLNLKNDAGFCRHFKIQPPTVSRFRNKKLMIGAQTLINIHQETYISIYNLKTWMGCI